MFGKHLSQSWKCRIKWHKFVTIQLRWIPASKHAGVTATSNSL